MCPCQRNCIPPQALIAKSRAIMSISPPPAPSTECYLCWESSIAEITLPSMTSNQHVSHCAAADLRKTLQCKKLSLWVKSHTHTHVAMKLKNRATTPVVSLPKGLQFKAATLYFRSQSQSNPFGRWSGKAGSQTPPVWTCFFYPDIYNYPTFFSADLLSVKCEFFFYLLRTALGEGPEATALPPSPGQPVQPPHPTRGRHARST